MGLTWLIALASRDKESGKKEKMAKTVGGRKEETMAVRIQRRMGDPQDGVGERRWSYQDILVCPLHYS